MTQKVVTKNESVAGAKHLFWLFSLLLKGIQQISGVLFVLVPISTNPNIQYSMRFYRLG
jgi:hypothetical protein